MNKGPKYILVYRKHEKDRTGNTIHKRNSSAHCRRRPL